MPPLTFLDDLDSSQTVLLAFAAVLAAGGVLYLLGVVNLLVRFSAWLIRLLLRSGFAAWVALFSWLPWPALLALIVAAQAVAFFTGPGYAYAYLAVGGALLFVGFTSVMAYMVIDQERYEVARGYKALHNPGKGQELAGLVLSYGAHAGLPLLISACLASVTGFAIFNSGLYNSFARRWYVVSEQSRYLKITDEGELERLSHREAGYADFLAFAVLNLASAVDVIDLANSSKYARLSYVRPSHPVSSVMLVAFRGFFTAILVQQLVAWFRGLRLLQDSVRDFWSPNESIQRRAGEALSQQGARAVGFMVRSMEQVQGLTPEQLEFLPKVLAAIGPSAVGALVQALAHPRAEVREVSVATLGLMREVRALPELSAAVRDPVERVRRALATAAVELFGDGVAAVRKRWLLERRLKSPGGAWRVFAWFRHRKAELPPDPVEVALPVLLALLEDEARTVRLAAVAALGGLGPAAAAAMPALVRLVEDEDAALRQALARALGEVREPAEEAVAALGHLLDGPDDGVRHEALVALAKCGADAAAEVPALVPLLQDSDEAIRQAAAEAIRAVGELDGPIIPKLTAGLKHRDNLLRARAAEAIGTIGEPAAAAAPELAAALADANDRVREQAAWALGRLGPQAGVATAALVKALGDEDFTVAAHAAAALGGIGEPAVGATPALLAALRHINVEVRRHAAAALAKVKAPVEAVAPALVALAGDKDLGVRLTAVEALGDLPEASEEVAAALVRDLGDESPNVRQAAIRSLAKLEVPPARLAGPFAALLADASLEVRAEAARAVGAWGEVPEATLAGLAALLDDPAEEVQQAAAQALAQLGPAAAGAEEALRAAFAQGAAALRELALKALAAVNADGNVGLFLTAVGDPSVDVRRLASAVLLRATAPLTAEQAAELGQGLKDPDTQLRSNVAQVLGRLEAVPAEAVPLLLECASHPDDGLRLLALRALKTARAQGAAVWPKMLQDPHPQVSFTAASYLLLDDADHEEAAAVLERAMASETIRDRRQAMELLEEMVPRAARFLPRLRQLLAAESDEELRAQGERVAAAMSHVGG